MPGTGATSGTGAAPGTAAVPVGPVGGAGAKREYPRDRPRRWRRLQRQFHRRILPCASRPFLVPGWESFEVVARRRQHS